MDPVANPEQIFRKEILPKTPSYFERNVSPAMDLAYLRDRQQMERMGGESSKRFESLINHKWRLIYSMRYRKEYSDV